MIGFLRTIRGTDPVSRDDAYEVFEVLIPVLQATADDTVAGSDAAKVASGTISRMPVDHLLAVVLDWWLVVSTGAPSPLGQAFHLSAAELTPPLKDAMDAVVGLGDHGLRVPPSRWVRASHDLAAGLRRLEDDLGLDSYGSSKFRGERDVWADLVSKLDPVVAALRNGEPTEPFTLDERAYRKEMKRWSIEEFSRQRSNEMLKRARECVARVNALVHVQSLVEPWIGRPTPPVVKSVPPEVAGALGPLGTVLLHSVVAADVTPPSDVAEEPEKVAARLAEIASGADEPGVSLLASIAGGWMDTTQTDIPALARMTERRSAVADRAERLRQAGVDVDEIQVHLLDHQVGAAERLVAQSEQHRDHQHHSTRLTRTLGRLRGVLWEGSAPEGWAEQLDAAAELLCRGDHTGAERALQVLDEEHRASQRAAAIVDLERSRNELDRLDAPSSLLVEIDQHLADLAAHPDRAVDADLVQRTTERLATLAGQRRREVEEYLHAAHDALEADRDLILSDVHAELERRLDEATSELCDGELMAAHQLACDLLAEVQSQRVHRWTAAAGQDQLVEHVLRYCTQQLSFDPADVRRLFVAAKAKPFVILAGLTGSGKSTIARLFAEALGADARTGRFRRIAVRPDWIDQSEVLGSINPFNNRFEPGWLAEVARQCERNLDQLHVVLLDEMNLAPVEQYLAEFLSAIEESRSGSATAALPLYSAGASPENAKAWPPSLPFPSNLIVIGTVNVDETTRVLSERVLDRANVLQLSVTISDAHHNPVTRRERPWYVPFSEWDAICETTPDDGHHEFLVHVGDILHSMDIGLGQRAHVELERFVANAHGILEPELSLDLGVLQRIIPKIRGFKRDLLPGLVELHRALDSVDCRRSAKVIARWTDDGVSDDEYLDGTDARIGLRR